MAGDGVLDQRVGEEVEELSTGAEAAGPPEVKVVVDLAVRSLSVAAPAVGCQNSITPRTFEFARSMPQLAL
jgi:hypothetical protein